MDHAFLKLVAQFAYEQTFEHGSGANFEIAMDYEAHVLAWNVKFEVCHLEAEDVSAILQLLPHGFDRDVERDVLASNIHSSLHGDVGCPVSKFA